MANLSLKELRERLKKKNDRRGNFDNTNNDVYPHWNIPDDTSATVRLLRDLNEDNENIFYIEKLTHKLPINGKDKQIACLHMYGEKCPICELSAKYYKAGDKVQGRLYYRNKANLIRALILKDPISAEGYTPVTGQVKTLHLTKQLMDVIINQLSNEDEETALSNLPWDIEKGHNFIIKRTMKKTPDGDRADYAVASGFSHKVTAVPEEYREAVEEGMVDLRTLIPENPGLAKVQAFLEAHLSGSEESEEQEASEEDTVKRPSARIEESEEDSIPRRPLRQLVQEAADEDEEEDDSPARKRTKVEDEQPKPSSRRALVADEEEDEEEDDEDAIISRFRARARRARGEE